jgi:hypothetical protein
MSELKLEEQTSPVARFTAEAASIWAPAAPVWYTLFDTLGYMGLKGQKLLDRPFVFSQGTAEFCFFLPSDSVDDTRIATDTYGHHIKQVHRSSCRRPRKLCESGARDEQCPSKWPSNKNPDVQLLCSHYCQIARALFFLKYVFCSQLKCFKIWPTLRSQWPTVRESHKPNFIHHPQVIT